MAADDIMRVYKNRDLGRIGNISVVILVAVFIYGLWELWAAFFTGSNDTFGAMFGVVFVGGGAIGMYTIWKENRDQPQWFDADFDTGRGQIALWRPFRPQVIDIQLADMRDWRYWIKVGKRNLRIHYLVAAVPDYPRPIYFDLTHTGDIPEGFRRLAPEAVAEYEESTGRADKDEDAE